MWRSPQKILEHFSAIALVIHHQTPELRILHLDPPPDSSPGLLRLCHMANRFNEAIRQFDPIFSKTSQRRYSELLLHEVRHIERTRAYDLVDDMMRSVRSMRHELMMKTEPKTWEALEDFWSELTNQIVILLGSESRVLVGVADGLPAWKEVRFPDIENAGTVSYYSVMTAFANHGVMGYVRPQDAWMVPRYDEVDANRYRPSECDWTFAEKTRQYIEDAFYRQRYVIDPIGAHVKLTNANGVTDLYIKVRRHADRGRLDDILVRAETDSGVVFFVLSEESLIQPTVEMSRLWPATYIGCLAACVYRDLVTLDDAELPIVDSEESEAKRVDGRHFGDASWTVIPRRAYKAQRQPRHMLTEANCVEPHRVSGHVRRVPMTAAHRDELLRFEEKTGLQVLRLIPKGCTFVRPHISPRVSPDTFTDLPRFIHFRIQQELEERVKSYEMVSM